MLNKIFVITTKESCNYIILACNDTINICNDKLPLLFFIFTHYHLIQISVDSVIPKFIFQIRFAEATVLKYLFVLRSNKNNISTTVRFAKTVSRFSSAARTRIYSR